MDLDQVLFGLDSFVSACEQGTLDPDACFTETYVTLLDQLAVLLRDTATREDPLLVDNLAKIAHAADYVLVRAEEPGLRPVAMEALRVLANAVADQPKNREIVIAQTQLIKDLGTQLEDNFDDDEINERVLIFLSNLTIDSSDIAETVAALITENLLVHIGYEDSFLSIDLLANLVSYHRYTYNIKNIERFISKLLSKLSDSESFDDDEFTETIINISTILEEFTLDHRLSFKVKEEESSVQLKLITCFESLEHAEFRNKLMAQRKIFGALGNVSANPSAHNKQLVANCLDAIQLPETQNGYVLASYMVIIGNSIASAADRNKILEQAPTLVTDVLSKYDFLTDPVQFQGILHILKGIVSFDTVGDFFTSKNAPILALLIEATVRNSRYYTNFTTLLTAFLKKLILLMGKVHVQILTDNNIMDSLLYMDSTYQNNAILLLLINKFAVYGTETDLDPLVSRVLEFKDPNIPASFVFELTKTIGVLLQNCANYTLTNHTEGILTLLDTGKRIAAQNNADNAVKAIENNMRYIAGSVVNLSKERNVDSALLSCCESLVRG